MLLTEHNLHVWLFDFAAKIKAGFRTKDLGGPYCHLVVKCCKIHPCSVDRGHIPAVLMICPRPKVLHMTGQPK